MNTNKADFLINELNENMKKLSLIANDISSMITIGSEETTFDENGIPIEEVVSNFSEHHGKQYEDILNKQDILKMDTKIAIDAEVTLMTQLELDMVNALKFSLEKGSGLVLYMINQVNMQLMDFVTMQNELKSWKDTLTLLSAIEEIEKKCDEFISENEYLEEQLLKLENDRIDMKSLYEKASLNLASRNCLQRRVTHSKEKSNISIDGKNKNEIFENNSQIDKESIQKKLLDIDNSVRVKRKDLRNWYRNNKKFAIESAPELFHYLPDFRTPGAILGDGGFAERAKVPRRSIDEYDDISPLGDAPRLDLFNRNSLYKESMSPKSSKLKNNSNELNKVSGRHLLLKATYDGEDFVLKGFMMSNYQQRKGFEKEISILSKLRNESIINPVAIVEGSNEISRSNDPLQQTTIFIQYPYYKGGNLHNWLKVENRKPWELQSVSRQVLHAIIYLHDHMIIHKVNLH